MLPGPTCLKETGDNASAIQSWPKRFTLKLGNDQLLLAGKTQSGFAPFFTFRSDRVDECHRLEERDFFDESLAASGWYSSNPRDRQQYWERRGMAHILMATIDPTAIRTNAIDPWLGKTRRVNRALLDGFSGTLQIENPEGQPVWKLPGREAGPARPPDYVFPVKNAFNFTGVHPP